MQLYEMIYFWETRAKNLATMLCRKTMLIPTLENNPLYEKKWSWETLIEIKLQEGTQQAY